MELKTQFQVTLQAKSALSFSKKAFFIDLKVYKDVNPALQSLYGGGSLKHYAYSPFYNIYMYVKVRDRIKFALKKCEF